MLKCWFPCIRFLGSALELHLLLPPSPSCLMCLSIFWKHAYAATIFHMFSTAFIETILIPDGSSLCLRRNSNVCFAVPAESATPPSHWSPGPGLIGSRGSGFGGSEDWPEPELKGAHAAYQQLFDRVHPTRGDDGGDAGDGQGVVPLDARQHSQESVRDVRRMASAGSRGSGSGLPPCGPNSAASQPWDSMSSPKYTLTHSTASPPPPPQAPVHKVLPPPRPAPHCLPVQPDSGSDTMNGRSRTPAGTILPTAPVWA